MSNEVYAVQAKHYAQFLVVEEEERNGPVEVEIMDSDDLNETIVAVRDTLEEAETAATEWIESCSSSEEDGIEHQPIAAVNILKTFTTGPARPSEFIKDMWQ